MVSHRGVVSKRGTIAIASPLECVARLGARPSSHTKSPRHRRPGNQAPDRSLYRSRWRQNSAMLGGGDGRRVDCTGSSVDGCTQCVIDTVVECQISGGLERSGGSNGTVDAAGCHNRWCSCHWDGRRSCCVNCRIRRAVGCDGKHVMGMNLCSRSGAGCRCTSAGSACHHRWSSSGARWHGIPDSSACISVTCRSAHTRRRRQPLRPLRPARYWHRSSFHLRLTAHPQNTQRLVALSDSRRELHGCRSRKHKVRVLARWPGYLHAHTHACAHRLQ